MVRYWIVKTYSIQGAEQNQQIVDSEQDIITLMKQGRDEKFYRLIECVELFADECVTTKEKLREAMKALEPTKPWDQLDEATLEQLWSKLSATV